MATRGPYRSGNRRREVVVGAGLEVFGELGFHGASVRDIAARAGIAHTSVLRLFGTKEALLLEVLAERDRRARRDFDLDTCPPLEMLRNLVHLAERNSAERGLIELYCVLSTEAVAPAHPAHNYFVERYAAVRQRLTEVFIELSDKGLLNSRHEPVAIARDVLAQSDGVQVQWLLAPGEVDLVEETRRFLQALVTVPLSEGDGARRQAGPPTTDAPAVVAGGAFPD